MRKVKEKREEVERREKGKEIQIIYVSPDLKVSFQSMWSGKMVDTLPIGSFILFVHCWLSLGIILKNHLNSLSALWNHNTGQSHIVAKLHPNLSCGFSSENEKLNASDKTCHKGQRQHYYNDVGSKSLNYVIVMHVEHTFNLSN